VTVNLNELEAEEIPSFTVMVIFVVPVLFFEGVIITFLFFPLPLNPILLLATNSWLEEFADKTSLFSAVSTSDTVNPTVFALFIVVFWAGIFEIAGIPVPLPVCFGLRWNMGQAEQARPVESL